MPRSHPSYPAEYRRKIVELVRAGRSIQSLAQEYEPCANTIAKWVKQADLDEDDGASVSEFMRQLVAREIRKRPK